MASQAREASGDRPIATNRRARHEYEILETVEAGLVLRGTEVKSLRDGLVNFKDSYASIRNDEGWLLGCHISPYSHGTDANHDPERDRKLLLHKKEIARWRQDQREGPDPCSAPSLLQGRPGEGGNRAGARQEAHDKRAALREREVRREMDKTARAARRGAW